MRERCPRPDKKRWPSRKAAQLALVAIQKMKPVSKYLKPYACPGPDDWDHWHLGNDGLQYRRDIRNTLRVGTAVSKRQQRVRKRR